MINRCEATTSTGSSVTDSAAPAETAEVAAAVVPPPPPPPPPPDWSELPVDLLSNVEERLADNVRDYVRFGGVCKAWRSAQPEADRPRSQLPWLILKWRHSERRLSFFCLGSSRPHTLSLPPAALPKTAGRTTCCGSCNGWLVLEVRQSRSLSLLNPITGALVQLPSAPPDLIDSRIFHDVVMYDGGKRTKYLSRSGLQVGLAMSSDPAAAEGCTVVVVSSWYKSLVSIRLGGSGDGEGGDGCGGEWELLDDKSKYDDVIYWKGYFYAVDNWCRVSVFEAAGLRKVVTDMTGPVTDGTQRGRYWRFAELSGELFLLCRSFSESPVVNGYMHPPKYRTQGFEILKVKMKEGGGDEGKPSELVVVKDLGENTIFYGSLSNSLGCPAAEYGGKPNAVYSAEEHVAMNLDGDDQNVFCCMEAVVYDMASGGVEPLPEGARTACHNSGCCSTWFTPRL